MLEPIEVSKIIGARVKSLIDDDAGLIVSIEKGDP